MGRTEFRGSRSPHNLQPSPPAARTRSRSTFPPPHRSAARTPCSRGPTARGGRTTQAPRAPRQRSTVRSFVSLSRENKRTQTPPPPQPPGRRARSKVRSQPSRFGWRDGARVAPARGSASGHVPSAAPCSRHRAGQSRGAVPLPASGARPALRPGPRAAERRRGAQRAYQRGSVFQPLCGRTLDLLGK